MFTIVRQLQSRRPEMISHVVYFLTCWSNSNNATIKVIIPFEYNHFYIHRTGIDIKCFLNIMSTYVMLCFIFLWVLVKYFKSSMIVAINWFISCLFQNEYLLCCQTVADFIKSEQEDTYQNFLCKEEGNVYANT